MENPMTVLEFVIMLSIILAMFAGLHYAVKLDPFEEVKNLFKPKD